MMKKLLALFILGGVPILASAQITQSGRALIAFGGTSDDTAAVQAVIAAVPTTGGVLRFLPGQVYKIGAAGIHFTNYTNLEVDFNGAQFQALANSTQNDNIGNFTTILFTNCTNCKVHGGNYDGKGFRSSFLSFTHCTDDEIYGNYSTNILTGGNYNFGSNSSTRLRWHDNTAVGAVVFFNGTITAASGTSATLTLNSTASGTPATGQTLSTIVEGNSQTASITSGTAPTFTITCTVACNNVAASNMTAVPTGLSVKGFWLGNSNVGYGDFDTIVGPGNKAIGNSATGFVLESTGGQTFGNYSNGNYGSGFISSTSTGSPSVDHVFTGNTSIGNSFHGYQTDVFSAVPVQRVTISGNRFEGNAGACMYLNYAQGFSITGNLCLTDDMAVQPVQEIVILGVSNDISIVGNTIKPNSNASDAGVQLSGNGAYVINNVSINGNNITCPANTAGIGVQLLSANSANFQHVSISNNVINNCNTGMTFRATAAGDTFNDLAVVGNVLNSMGSYWVRFSSSTANQLTNARVIGNTGTSLTIDTNTVLAAEFGNSWNLNTGTAPIIGSGFGTGASVTKSKGYTSFSINVGTGGTASVGTVNLPATSGWACTITDVTNPTANLTQQTGSGSSSATFTNFVRTTGVAGAWPASDILQISCAPN